MPAQDPFIGRPILNGQFQILQKVGSGGMGAVYKALQPEMNRMVGVKILHPRLANRKDLVSRFRREARALSQLTHPNTVKVFLFGELEDGSLYIIMEFLEGKNLNQTVRAEGPFAMERALPVLIQVCGALAEAHAAGIIHRDLKPENIFLVQAGPLRDFPKVLDFGLAKVGERQMRPGSVILTQEGMVFGTPEFMSPEQAQGKPLTAASDIYSLAVILYEVLTGKLPFEARTTMDYIQLHVTAPPIPLSQRVAGRSFSPALDAVVARALTKRTEERFGSAEEFAAAMQGVLGVPSVSAVGAVPSVSVAASAAVDPHGRRAEGAPASRPVEPRAAVSAAAKDVGGERSLSRAATPALALPLVGAGAAASPAVPVKAPARARAKANVPLLVVVAIAFLGLGAALAAALVRYVIK